MSGTMARTACRLFLGGTVLLALASAGPALGQSGNVPDGAVIDAVPFPDLRPGGRIGFRRPDQGRVK